MDLPEASTSREQRDNTSLLFRVNRLPYFFIFVPLYLCLSALILQVLKVRDALPALLLAGPFAAAPAWTYLWTCLSGSSFRLTGDRLDIGGSESRGMRLCDVVTLASSLRKSAKDHASILIATADQRKVIRRWLNIPSSRVYKLLCDRVEAHQVPRHLPSAQPDEETDSDAPVSIRPWPRYPDAPSELIEIYQDLDKRGLAGDALLFRGRVRKPAGAVWYIRPYFIWMIILSAIGAGLMASQNMVSELPIAAGFGIAGLICSGLTFIPGRRPREWLLLHADGIAMMGPDLTGELSWKDVVQFHESPARTSFSQDAYTRPNTEEVFLIESRDGARIGVSDHYDSPLVVVLRCCRHMRSDYRIRTKNVSDSATPEAPGSVAV